MRKIGEALHNATHGERRKRSKRSAVAPVAMLVVVFVIAQIYWLRDNQHLFRPFAIQRVYCDLCGRTGVVEDPSITNRFVICPQCFGVGHHLVRRMDDADRLCPACIGMGRVQDPSNRTWRTCERCDGRGLIRDETPSPQ